MTRVFCSGIVFLLFIFVGCTHPIRKIASVDFSPPVVNEQNFLDSLKIVLSDVKEPSFNSSVCTNYLSELEDHIDQINVTRLNLNQIMVEGKQAADISWEIRKNLHKRLNEFDEDCVEQIQANLKQFRFVEDYLLERFNKVTDLAPAQIDFQRQPIPMKESSHFYMFRSEGKELKLKGGDILVSRGVSFLSGMIARLGMRGTQFSHVVFVSENETTKEIKTIESYVGSGVGFYHLDFALKNENARILWLRPKDRSLAKKASDYMTNYVQKRIDDKNPIKYDYALDFKDHSTMSCAEVSVVAFKEASQGEVIVPFYPNEIRGAQSLLNHIGLKPGVTFEPGDLEIDPRFELMGEFQDLRLTRDSRHKDAIMTELFRWMDEEGYELHDSFNSKMAGGLIYNLRRTPLWPLVQKALKVPDFSKEIPRKMLRTVTLLNQIGEVLLEVVQKKDQEFQAKYQVPMTYHELYQVLEEFREKDLKLYLNKKTRKESQFHSWFRPKK
jgi:hypothetical protein